MKKVVCFISIIILFILIFCYSKYIEPHLLKTYEYNLYTNIDSNFHGLKIVHISDIHYKDDAIINKLTNEVNNIKPDIIVFTGDLFHSNNISSHAINKLYSMESKIGKYAVSSSLDLNKNYSDILKNIGFELIDNKCVNLYYKSNDAINICGISTLNDGISIKDKISNLNNNGVYNILISHDSDIIDNIDYNNYNLVLTGSSNGGEIVLPIIGGIYTEKYNSKYTSKKYKFNNTDIFVSNGIGSHKYNMRFMNIPSINLYRLITKG